MAKRNHQAREEAYSFGPCTHTQEGVMPLNLPIHTSPFRRIDHDYLKVVVVRMIN